MFRLAAFAPSLGRLAPRVTSTVWLAGMSGAASAGAGASGGESSVSGATVAAAALRTLPTPAASPKASPHGRAIQERKQFLWQSTAEAFDSAGVALLVQVNSLKRSQLEAIRAAAHPDAKLLLLKNSVARSVLQSSDKAAGVGEAGPGSALASLLLGPTALLYASDLSPGFKDALKVVAKMAPGALVVGGFVDGAVLDAKAAADLDGSATSLARPRSPKRGTQERRQTPLGLGGQ